MIDINKKYCTAWGQEVRIYATDGGGNWPIHGAMKNGRDNIWVVTSWDVNGKYHYPECDLVEAKPRIKQKLWFNVYRDHTSGGFFTKKEADAVAGFRRIGCVQVEIDIEEGEGLT
jgi:hypothetical protein